MIKDFFKERLHAFSYALQGWNYILRTQANSWIHATTTFFVIIFAFWLHLPARDWAVLFLAIAIVWAAEFFNTAVESIIDLVSPQKHPLAKISKDVSAAAVLITALISVLIGFLILGPPLWEKISLY